MFLLNSCEGPVTPDPEPDPGKEDTLTPPDEVKSSNVFVVDMFSTLEDDGDFFEKRDVASAAQHIAGQPGKKPLIYMFDRADFTVGESHPLNKLSYTANIYQLFAQHEPTSATVTKGTSMATQYPVNLYDGLAQEGAYMSGLTVSAPLSTATPVCIYTSRISTLDQMQQIKKMGPLKDLLGMLPGIPGIGKLDMDALGGVDPQKEMAKTEAIIQSMTKEERRNPSILNGPRKKRIAAGCGRSIADVNRLLKQFEEMKKMMKLMNNMTKGKKGKMPFFR